MSQNQMIQENSEHFKQEVHKKRVCLDSLKRSNTHLSRLVTELGDVSSVTNVRISYSALNLNSPNKIDMRFAYFPGPNLYLGTF